MTIIIGMVCEDGVVVCSDSQAMSSRGVDVKRLDYTKIYSFNLNSDLKVLVTGAGETPFITRAVELLQSRWKEKRVQTTRELADLAEETMNAIQKRYVVDRMKELGITGSKGLETQHFTKPFKLQEVGPPNFALLLGVVTKHENAIYTVYPNGVAEKAERYTSLGSGSAYAEYLLARLCCAGLKLDESVKLGIYIIEEVKKIDPNCGGATQVALATIVGINHRTDSEVKSLADEIMGKDMEFTRLWRGTILDRKAEIEEVVQARLKELKDTKK
jgi:20S proteasome alpha/beta subunit